MNFSDGRWKVYKGHYLTGDKEYWMFYRMNDFGEPTFICDTFEEVWDKIDEKAKRWKKKSATY